ncbi:MAG: hypothetical protein Q9216_003932 [Gyalolechia sp. 2 TL-2023]
MLPALSLILFLLTCTATAQQPACSLASFDRCGPAEQEPGTPSTCNATVKVSSQPDIYTLQCRQNRNVQANLNYQACLNAIVDICNKLTFPHVEKDRWIWTPPSNIGCALGFWLPSGNGSDAAFAPTYERCQTGIFEPIARACTNPAWNNVGGVNLRTLPDGTTSGEAVNPLYPSYVIGPNQLTTAATNTQFTFGEDAGDSNGQGVSLNGRSRVGRVRRAVKDVTSRF